MINYIRLMRPKHYLKNVLILFPLIFSGLILELNYLIFVLLGFISFSLIASTVYIINDIKDKEKDLLHEKKKKRPIAEGKIKINHAIIFAIILFILALIFNYFAINKYYFESYFCILFYIIINILYSFGFKKIPLVDVTIIVLGFLIRVLYGAIIIGVGVSSWLYLTIIAISFYLGLGKRRNEIIKK